MQRQARTYRNLKPLEEARQILFTRFAQLRMPPETVAVREALGRYLWRPVKAARSVPAYHGAAVDGIAVRAASTFAALPESPAFLRTGTQAIPINTGQPLPEGTDAVVMIEKAGVGPDQCQVWEAVYPWQNVRKAGEDLVKGEILLAAHHQVRAWDQAALLSAGVLSVDVFRKPRVLIIPTGSEIVRPEDAGDRLPAGAILEVNGQYLASSVAECGGEAVLSDAVSDDPSRIRDAVSGALNAGFDAILIIAGSSAGSEDYTPAALAEMGELLVHGVSIMPGKPALLAAVNDRPVFGIPGYPVSAAITFREFVRPLLYRMQGVDATPPPTIEAVLGRKVPSRPGLEEHVRVVLGEVNDRVMALPLASGAGVLTSLVRADAILRIPAPVTGYAEGDQAAVELLVPRESIAGRLIAIGSHDLTIDLLGSLLRQSSAGRYSLASSNVGSMGGLLAIDRGVAHLAGTHLLDPETGDYNRSYIRRYITHAAVTVVTLVHRWQGLMVAAGNPKGIRGIADLARPQVSFVNRQAGSGTRVLLDYELGRAGIASTSIPGYRSEEYTHMNVAMAVASGRADCGLGIRAAADALELDFIPIARERYDLVLPAALASDGRVAPLLEIIRSDTFKSQAQELGGYETEETGKVVEP